MDSHVPDLLVKRNIKSDETWYWNQQDDHIECDVDATDRES